ncbi:hypothetical protein E4U13_001670 [Claviceps humidiphila]|uniref:Uncharacterized protein n=1 Tax=Claviceps humidiphila TaxID=1294629 RepID=A0A9P7TTL6_9HYPO|nr:hypothetical protein E4U13_001670 [Claviceps humidiphila]
MWWLELGRQFASNCPPVLHFLGQIDRHRALIGSSVGAPLRGIDSWTQTGDQGQSAFVGPTGWTLDSWRPTGDNNGASWSRDVNQHQG